MDKNLNNIFVISSPSGGGKSSLIEALFSEVTDEGVLEEKLWPESL